MKITFKLFFGISLCLILISSNSAYAAFQWIPSHPLKILPLKHQDNKTTNNKTIKTIITKTNKTQTLVKKITIKHIPTPINNSVFIGIILSNSCIIDLKWGLKTNCPTYKELVPWDTTSKQFSGYFADDNGFYHRMPAKYKNHYAIYDYVYNSTIISVDPDSEFVKHTHMKIIFIEGSNFTYADPSMAITNATRYVYENAYATGCETVTMTWNNQTLGKIIDYLKSGCSKRILPTSITIKQTKTDYTTSHTYQYNQWLQTIKSNLTKTNCIIHKCDIKPIDHNWN